jgi:hypothetical protein
MVLDVTKSCKLVHIFLNTTNSDICHHLNLYLHIRHLNEGHIAHFKQEGATAHNGLWLPEASAQRVWGTTGFKGYLATKVVWP